MSHDFFLDSSDERPSSPLPIRAAAGELLLDDFWQPTSAPGRGPLRPAVQPAVIPPQRQRGHAIIAWLAIMGVLAALVAVSLFGPEEKPVAYRDSMERYVVELQGKYFVGAAQITPLNGSELFDEAQKLQEGPVGQHMCFIVLAGELVGPSRALEVATNLRRRLSLADVELSDAEKNVLNVLERVYADYKQDEWAAPSVDEAERGELQAELGWYGELALAPAKGPDTAAREAVVSASRRTAIVMLCFIGVAAMMLMGGFAVLITTIVVWATQGISHRVRTRSGFGGVYAETFALWLVGFTGLQIGALFLPEGHEFLKIIALSSLSMLAVVWPVLRGRRWAFVREDIGWTLGKTPALEPFYGVVGYLATLPLLLAGVVLMLMMMFVFGVMSGMVLLCDFTSPQMPTHPIVQWIGEADWWGRVLVFLIACVIAPFTEETMFRGVLYRHLRDTTAPLRITISVAISAVVNAFIFAAIHPQGLLGIPPLMALAVGFTLIREWRGSLLASMTAHGLNNGLVMTLLLLTI